MKRIRIIPLLIAILMLLASCTPAVPGSTTASTSGAVTTGRPTTEGTTDPVTGAPATTAPATTAPTTTEPTTTEPVPIAQDLVLAKLAEELEVALLFPRGSTVEEQNKVEPLITLFSEHYATDLCIDYTNTTYTYDAAIVLLDPCGDAKAEQAQSQLRETGCAVLVSGNRVYLLSATGDLNVAVSLLMDLLCQEEQTLSIPTETNERCLLVPPFNGANATLAGGAPYVTSELDFQNTYQNVTAEEVLAYCDELELAGYQKYDENTIGKVIFYTYVLRGERVILQHNTHESFLRIGVTYGQYLPPLEAAPYETLVDASIANIRRRERSGLGLIIQLVDGTFVILDGGYLGGPNGGSAPCDEDREALYEYLMTNKPEEHEKPIISAWILSHAHGDHDDAITVFLSHYGDEVELLLFAHHFPDFLRHPCRNEVEGQGHNYYGEITLEKIRKLKPDAIEWVVHTGQKLPLAGAELEILYTCEDLYPAQPYGINDTNTTYRLTVGDKTVMLLGDSDSRANNQMALYYGDALLSDILQAAHHSANGEPLQYQAIDPKICFWAQKTPNIQTSRPCNQYLLSTKWSRTDAAGNKTEGDRQFIPNDVDACIYFKDIV